eukprot:5706351-Alexandrium_andersonii.AAC.1
MASRSLNPEEWALLHMVHFKPTLACPARPRQLSFRTSLMGSKRHRRSHLGYTQDAVELLVVLELPDCGVAREYLAYQN